ncbi:hypothetical protein OPV22_024712 [Ensete ventricosum]|uniref:Uncharacterized protein n=1 Tax=Ensete ventricosum TaxID=4639 RepID=A0AAV8Q1S8_ENSVE|nr:hypothetical protein OPV22_024712 [Ensete ventricosum]
MRAHSDLVPLALTVRFRSDDNEGWKCSKINLIRGLPDWTPPFYVLPRLRSNPAGLFPARVSDSRSLSCRHAAEYLRRSAGVSGGPQAIEFRPKL